MHEYRLESDENAPPQEDGWVVCRAFKKRNTVQTRSIVDVWDSGYGYDDSRRPPVNSITGSMEYLQARSTSLCKQESEIESLNLLHSNQFVQLPQLESPSMPLVKNNSSLLSITSENEDGEKVTDWRALDKFVASQLSHEERSYDADHQQCSELGVDKNSEMALLLLGSGDDHEGGSKLNGLLSSSLECDFGVCVFGK
ncbi:hypothetical protein J5N97_021657 [Dioscorea zingiberensis]|uniref:NAC domain-containing protein n=1 Tax=Dioscorea zingiberensis TaxID=325984 RepID=A0A9D5C9Q8_9LILI|nr:hypothetical protein J5N97_021657 [Dioscorea zingiberensis]